MADIKRQGTIEEFSENRPNPTDFGVFLPWATKEYNVDADVVVTRGIQVVYVSAATHKKQGQKRKLSNEPSNITTQEPASREEYHDSEIDETVPNVSKTNIVNIETVYDSDENLVQVKLLRNNEIPRKVMQIFALTIPYQQHLTSITINSGLRMDSFYELSKCLPESQITELCLDGTSLSQANYDILLTHSKLKHLSLARCNLNDAIVNTIADRLKEPCPAATVLSALNLSSNRITDIGAKHLAEVLRINRKLCYLNLAGNMITDKGGLTILDTLQKFPLQTEELLESRARYVTYLEKRNDLINAFITELQTTVPDKNYKKRPTKRAKLESSSMQQQYELTAEAQIILERAEVLADNKLGSYIDPFSPSNTETHNGVVHCCGNNTLCYLNLAYNNLTYVGVKKLLEVLTAQKYLNRTPRGLIKVLIEGNMLPTACEEYEDIEILLRSVFNPVKRRSEIAIKKKPLSGKSTTR